MISSEDVRHVTFDKAFQGYRREDVDDYLKQVAQAMDDLAAQNDDLQKKLVMLAQRIEKYRTMENSLSTSMINAQRMQCCPRFSFKFAKGQTPQNAKQLLH